MNNIIHSGSNSKVKKPWQFLVRPETGPFPDGFCPTIPFPSNSGFRTSVATDLPGTFEGITSGCKVSSYPIDIVTRAGLALLNRLNRPFTLD